jgi:AcrR family transcriptional regulator
MRQVRTYCLTLMGDTAEHSDPPNVLADRILEAALRCIARWGITKTTLDDVAREAGCSRATIYRAFPGGKQSVVYATGERELRRFLDELSAKVAAAGSLHELLTIALVEGVTAIGTHEALQYLIVHEPGPVLALVSFDGLEPLLTLGTEFGAPELERFLTPQAARETAEWVVRVIIGHGLEADCHDLTDRAVADRFVATFMLPGLEPDLRPDRRPGVAA